MEDSEPTVSSAPAHSSGSSPLFLSSSRQRGRPRSPYTHVITGVQHGAVVSIQFEQQPSQDSFSSLTAKKLQNQNQKQQQQQKTEWSDDEIEEHLETQMEIVKNVKKARELALKYFKEFPDAPKFNMEITGDIPYDRDGNVDGFSFDVLGFVQRVPENLNLIQDGKGYPISFDVTSLKDILANIALNSINSQDSESEAGFKSVPDNSSASDLTHELKPEFESHPLKRNVTETSELDLDFGSEMTENETE